MISMDMLRDAQRVLAPVINYTPVVPTKGPSPAAHATVINTPASAM